MHFSMVTPLMTLVMLAVTVLSCVSDVRRLRIPNWHSLLVLVCFIPAYLAGPQAFSGIWAHVGAMGIMFVVTYLMFAFGMIGGGDSKLGSALGLWVGLKGFMPFMFYMAVMGGVVGVISLIIAKKKPFAHPAHDSWAAQAQAGKNAIPYGVAISFGAWAALFYTGFIHNQLNEVFKIIH